MKSNKILKVAILICVIVLCLLVGYYFLIYRNIESYRNVYIASNTNTATLIDEENNTIDITRGTLVRVSDKKEIINDEEYFKINYNEQIYYSNDADILVERKEDTVLEKELYVYRTCSIYEDDNSSKICGMIEKGNKISIIGHSEVLNDGSVERYKFEDGYVLSKYLTSDEDLAISHSNFYEDHKNIFAYDDSEIVDLDFYPNQKPVFEDNVMPDEVKAIYVNDAATYEIDDYIDLAVEIGANALVIDIRDSSVVNLKADTMKQYCPSAYEAGKHTKDEFINIVDKCKEKGLYTIARITVFKDPNYADDHNDQAIIDKETNDLFVYGNAKWPSAYSRECWEYNVELAKECIRDIGFNEIQFDYVRFPEHVGYFNDMEKSIDLRNIYGETRSQTIQRFLMYACEEIHKVNGYVSADVFGETSNNYVCDYGQYWPAISNVVDVISPMPYPDHFGNHDYDIKEYVWEVPYELLFSWANQAKCRQDNIETPAKVRTWLQGYNSIKKPTVIYDDQKVIDQVNGLKNAGLYDGFMIWNSLSDYEKYKSYKKVFN